MKKLTTLFIIIFVFATAGALLGKHVGGFLPERSQQPVDTKKASIERITPPAKNEIGSPVTITIPKLDVEAPIEHVGLDAEKRMDVPKNVYNTAWYMLGPKPGEPGNAVIAGHLDTPSGQPSVFYNIADLESGDEIVVTDEHENSYTFVVTAVEVYKDATFPVDEVFSPEGEPQLNLITCSGTFNQATQNYSDRTVVSSRLISPQN